MGVFGAEDRAKLTQELRDELYDLVHEYSLAATLTVPEVIGVLEMLKFELIMEQSDPDFSDGEGENDE